MKKHEIAVFIENEEMLKEAKKDRTCTNNCSVVCGECQLPIQALPQLEEILKNQ